MYVVRCVIAVVRYAQLVRRLSADPEKGEMMLRYDLDPNLESLRKSSASCWGQFGAFAFESWLHCSTCPLSATFEFTTIPSNEDCGEKANSRRRRLPETENASLLCVVQVVYRRMTKMPVIFEHS